MSRIVPCFNFRRGLVKTPLGDSDIGRLTKIVDDRNDSAHANGNIYLRDQGNLEQKINDMEQCFSLIQNSAKPVIESTYQTFLENSQDPDNREWLDDKDQVQEVLIHQNYFSLEDIRQAQTWDVAKLSGLTGYQNIQTLASCLASSYAQDEVLS